LDSCLRINGNDAPKAFNGSSWVTTGGAFDLANMPSNVNLCLEWKDRVYVAGDYTSPDKLYYSGIADASTRAVSWTSGNGYIMMEQEDGGGGITALAKCPGYLLVFKRRSLKRWDGSSTYPDDMVRQGTPTQECVCYSRGMVAFLNEQGIWGTVGSMPKHLSDVRVDDFIQAITDFNKVQAGADEKHLFFYIGDVTVDNVSYSNVMLKYNIDYQTWDIRSYYQEIKAIADYVDSNSKRQLVMGDDDGNVGQINTGLTDMTKSIPWTVETHKLEFTSRVKTKNVHKFYLHTEQMKGGNVFVKTDEDSKGSWSPRGVISGDVSEIDSGRTGRWFQFKASGSSNSGGDRYLGLEFSDNSIEVHENA